MTFTTWRTFLASALPLLLVSCEREETSRWIPRPAHERWWGPIEVWRSEGTGIIIEAVPVPTRRFNKHIVLKRDGEDPVTIEAPEEESWHNLVLCDSSDKAYVLVSTGRPVAGRADAVEFHETELVEIVLPSRNESLCDVTTRVLWERDCVPFVSSSGDRLVALEECAGDGRGLLVRALVRTRPVVIGNDVRWHASVVEKYFDLESRELGDIIANE